MLVRRTSLLLIMKMIGVALFAVVTVQWRPSRVASRQERQRTQTPSIPTSARTQVQAPASLELPKRFGVVAALLLLFALQALLLGVLRMTLLFQRLVPGSMFLDLGGGDDLAIGEELVSGGRLVAEDVEIVGEVEVEARAAQMAGPSCRVRAKMLALLV